MNAVRAVWAERFGEDRERRLLLLAAAAVAVMSVAAAAVKPAAGLAAAVVLPVMVALLAWPTAPILLVVFILYSNAAVVAVRFHGVPVLAGAATPLLLAIPLAYYLVIRRERVIVDRVLPWIVLFLLVQLLSAVFCGSPLEALGEVANSAIEGLALYFLIINVVRTPQMLRRVTWVLLAAGAFMGGLSAFQQFTGTYGSNYGGFAQMSNAEFDTGGQYGMETQRRLAGPLGSQNRYAQIMQMLLPLGIFRFLGERSAMKRILAAAATALITTGMTLTFSRGAAVATVLLLVIMVLLRYIQLRQCAIVVAIGAIVLLSVPQYAVRLMSLERLKVVMESGSHGISAADGSVQSRYTEMAAAFLMFAEHPLLGVGPGMYPDHYHAYAGRVGWKVKETARQPHTLYLGLLAELGTSGLAVYLVIVFLVLRALARTRRQVLAARPEMAILVTGYLLALVSYLCTALFLHFAFIRYFWLMLALAMAAIHVIQSGRNEISSPRPATYPW